MGSNGVVSDPIDFDNCMDQNKNTFFKISAEEKSYMLGVIFGWTIRLSLLLSTFYMGTTNKRQEVVRKKAETGSDVIASEVQTQISLMSTKAQLVRACLLTAKLCFTYLKIT